MTRVMLDGVYPDSVPTGAPMYLGYVDGAWPDYQAFVAREPHALHVSCTTTGRPGARVFDIETGDGTPSSGADWALNELHASRIPCLYSYLSLWPAIDKECHARGIYGKVLRFLSHPQGDGTIPPGFIAVQWKFAGGYDESSVADYWPGLDPTPTPPSPDPVEDDMPRYIREAGQDAVYATDGVWRRWVTSQAQLGDEHAIWGPSVVTVVSAETMAAIPDVSPTPAPGQAPPAGTP